jgi:hypothetical protein
LKRLPTDRPPTRAEVWNYYHGIYFDLKGHKPSTICTPRCNTEPEGELERFCQDEWVWGYVYWFNFKDWRKQPEWLPGQDVIPSAVPDRMFESGAFHQWRNILKQMIDTAKGAA